MKGDLHCHSTASDGVLTPAELCQQAQTQGLDVLAITDHETLSGAIAATVEDVRLIAGIEIAAYRDETELHMLAYLPGKAAPALHSLLEQAQGARRRRAEIAIDRLRQQGVEVDARPVLERSGSIGRPHIADALVAAGHARSRSEAFARYLVPGTIGYVPRDRISFADVIRATHEDGGIVSLAHPLHYAHVTAAEVRRLGFDALEAYHPSAGIAEQHRLARAAHDCDLLVTGGSDFHGSESPVPVGGCVLQGEELEAFLKRLDG